MTTNTDITLWHSGEYDKKTRMDLPPIRQYFPAAAMQKDIKVTVDNGLKSADVIKIRIPGDVDIKIKNGDRVAIGRIESELPTDDAFTVIGFADNRKGSRNMWHWKVICG